MASDTMNIDRDRRTGFTTAAGAINGIAWAAIAVRHSTWLAVGVFLVACLVLYRAYWTLRYPAVEVIGEKCTIRGGLLKKEQMEFRLPELVAWEFERETSILTVTLNDGQPRAIELWLDASGQKKLWEILENAKGAADLNATSNG